MAFGRISGPLLKSNLTRDGVDLAFENNLVYLRVTDSDPTNHRVGIKNDNPLYTLDVGGTVNATTVLANSANITTSLYAGALYDNNSRVATVAGGISQFATVTTTDIVEGTNLYFTTARARSSVSATGSIHYDSNTGVFTYVQGNTDTVSEGTTNLYFTTARARASLSASGAISYNSSTGAFTFTQGNTDTVSEGTTNKYFTDARARSAISVSGDLAYNSATGVISYTHGNTDTVSEGTTNLYFTTNRARAAISGTGSINYNNVTGVISYTQGNTDTVSEGTTNKYYTDTRARNAISVSGDLAYNSATGVISYTHGNTDTVSEGTTNLYFTTARARASLSASGSIGYNSTSGAFTYTQGNTDTVSEGTTNKYYTDTRARLAISVSGDLAYNSATGVISYTHGNTDTVSEGSINKYYTDTRARLAISTAVTTTAGLASSASLSYNNATGVVTFNSNTDNITEGTTNKYYTDTRARSAISVSGDLSYNSATGVISYTHGNTDTVSEGTTNLYFTTARARATLSASGSIGYNSTTGAFTYTQGNTDTVSEGTTNKYYTDARARAALSASGSISYNSTTGAFTYTQGNTDTVSEGTTNKYYTDTRARAAISSSSSSLVYDSSTGVFSLSIGTLGSMSGQNANSVAITGGAINGTVIGGTTPAAGTFTSLHATGNLTIDGNFTVSGSLTTINATSLSVSDNMIYLNNGSTNANPDIGFAGNYNDGSYHHTGLFRDATDGVWKFFQGYAPEPDASIYIDTADTSFAFAPIQVAAITSATGTFSGQLTSTVSNGTAPFVVASSTLVTNLNADLLDGQHGAYYTTANNLTGTIPQGVLDTSTLYVGTTAVSLARGSAAQALTGINSVTLPGSTSGSIQIIPSAVAGTGTVVTLPAVSGTVITSGDTGTVTNAMLAGSITNAKLVNSSVTIGTTAISLGSSSVTLAGLTSVSATTFTGSLTGNASTVTNGVYTTDIGSVTNTMLAGSIANSKLSNSSININGTDISLGASGTVTAAAGTLTGTTLNSTVVNSSLTSVGTLSNLTVTNTITGSITGNAGTVTNGVYTTGAYTNPSWIGSLAYSKLTGAPTLSTVATSGSYTDLTNKPTLSTVAASGSYTDLTNKPTFATVATSGSYTDLTNKPVFSADKLTSGVYTASLSSTDGSLRIPGILKVGYGGSYALVEIWDNVGDYPRGGIKTHPTDANKIVVSMYLPGWSLHAAEGIAALTTGATGLMVSTEAANQINPTSIIDITHVPGEYTITFNQSINAGLFDWNVDGFNFTAVDVSSWQFNTDNSITFPDSTVQSTAWTGIANYNNLTNKPAIPAIARDSISVTYSNLPAAYEAGVDYSTTGFLITGNTVLSVTAANWNNTAGKNEITSLLVGRRIQVYMPLDAAGDIIGTSIITIAGNWSNDGVTYSVPITVTVPVKDFYAYTATVLPLAIPLDYNRTTGVFTANIPDTDDIAEGNTNLYFTNARVIAALPSQTNNGGRYLFTNGNDELSWQDVPAPFSGDYNALYNKPVIPSFGNFTFNSNILTVNGTNSFTHIFQGTSDFYGSASYWGSMTGNELRFIIQTASGVTTPAMAALDSAGPGSQITITDGTHSTTVTIDSNGWTQNGAHYSGIDYYWVCNTVETNSHNFSWFSPITRFAIGSGSLESIHWEFGSGLTFPDTTVQSTAWLGTYSYNDLTDKPVLRSSAYIGTTNLDFTRASAAQTLTGVSIDGNAGTVTNGVYTTDSGTVTNTMLAGSIDNSKLANSSITINGTAVALGGSTTVTMQSLTFGSYFTVSGGGTYNGSAAKTVNITGVVTLLDPQVIYSKSFVYMSVRDATDANKRIIFDATQTRSGGATLYLPYIDGSTATMAVFSAGTTNLPAGSISNSVLANSTITINGTAVSLGGSITVSGGGGGGTTINPLTVGTGLTLDVGTTFDGSASRTISIASNVVTTSAAQTLTNKTISGSANTLSNIANSALTNSAITINGTSVSLGGSISGLATTAALASSFITINGSNITLGNGISGLAATANNLTQFATTTSTELASIISGKTGTGSLVFASVSVAPTTGQALVWNGSTWVPGNVSGGTLGGGTARVLDTITPDGVTSAFQLRYAGNLVTPSSSAALIVTLDGVYQIPESAYNVLGSTITFAAALLAGTAVAIVEQGASGSSGGSSTLAGLSDIALTTPTDGQTLVWNTSAGKWVNGAGGSGFYTGTTTVVTASTVAADTFIAADYTTAKYLIQATVGSDIHSTELTVIHNGTTAYSVEYGTIYTTSLFSVDASLVTGNVLVNVTTTLDNTTVDFKRVSIVSRLPGLTGDLSTLSGTEDLSSGTGSVDLMA